MKRVIFAVCALAMALLVLAGCSGKQADTPKEEPASTVDTAADKTTDDTPADSSADNAAADSGLVPDEPAVEAKTVSPLPSGIDPDHLDNCTVPVSFAQGDAYVDDTGAMQLKVQVYDYDTFDIVDVSMLQVGDHITICRQDVEVTSLEHDETGAVILNGGPENGGYKLIAADGSGFCAVGADGEKQYYALAEATFPVSVDFEFEDSSDPAKEAITYYPGDFLTDTAGIVYNFLPNNTTITIQDGSVIHMQRTALTEQ